MMEKTTTRKINSILETEYTVFICSASFEHRCLVLPDKVKKKKFEKVIIVANKNGADELKEKCKKLQEIYSSKSICLLFDLKESIVIANQIMREISLVKSSKKMSILLDISTFTHETLMILLKVLKDCKRIDSITCVYVNVAEYCPGVPLEKKWLSKGAEPIHPIMGYPGMITPSKKTHLIVIVGYEYSRAFSAISDVEPFSISLIYGSSSSATTEKDKDANSFFKNLVEEMAFEYSNVQDYQIPCSDAEQVSKTLNDIYSEHIGENIIVIPMNNKISTLGVFLSVQNNENIQICYAPAVLYNERNYSSVGSDCYIYKF